MFIFYLWGEMWVMIYGSSTLSSRETLQAPVCHTLYHYVLPLSSYVTLLVLYQISWWNFDSITLANRLRICII